MRTPLVVLVFVVIFAPSIISAHAFGASLEATSTPYFIDIGYDPDPMEANRATRFEIELRNLDREMVQDHEYVWVRILRGEETILATGIHRQFFGPTTLLYTFAERGDHEMHISFRTREGKELASAEFPIVVASQMQYNWPAILTGCAALVGFAAFGVYRFAMRRMRASVQ